MQASHKSHITECKILNIEIYGSQLVLTVSQGKHPKCREEKS